MSILIYKWALLAQHIKTGELKIWDTYSMQSTCDQLAEQIMIAYPWVEAACFQVYL